MNNQDNQLDQKQDKQQDKQAVTVDTFNRYHHNEYDKSIHEDPIGEYVLYDDALAHTSAAVARAVAYMEAKWEASEEARRELQQAAQASPVAATIDRINMRHGAYITREAKTTGANGWVLRNEHGLVRALTVFEEEFVDYTLVAHTQQPAAVPAEQVQNNDGVKPAGFDVCPISGRPFWGNIDHPKRGMLATYGGPFDTYSIPYLDEDDELRVERFDQDRGEWIEGGEPFGWYYSEQQPEYSTPAQPPAGELPVLPALPAGYSKKSDYDPIGGLPLFSGGQMETFGRQSRAAGIEEAAKLATSFLVGDPANGIPLRSPMPHEIATAIRALNKTGAQ